MMYVQEYQQYYMWDVVIIFIKEFLFYFLKYYIIEQEEQKRLNYCQSVNWLYLIGVFSIIFVEIECNDIIIEFKNIFFFLKLKFDMLLNLRQK